MLITGTNFRVTQRVLVDCDYVRVPSHALSRVQHLEEWLKPVRKGRPFPRFHIIKKYARIYELHLDKYAKHGKDFEVTPNGSVFTKGKIVEAEMLRIFSCTVKLNAKFYPKKKMRNEMLVIMLHQYYAKFLQKFQLNEKGNTNS